MDFPAIIEEIALEGLDGITINALWQRLEDRPDFVKGNLDDAAKRFIWKYVAGVQDLEFYLLPEPRPELVIFRYSDFISPEDCKCIMPLDTPADIYSHDQVDECGIRGSCDHFQTRTKITDVIRSYGVCLMSLDEVIDRWGQSMVIVASQKQRNLALLGCVFNPAGLSTELYCTLEAVGRARYEGDITSCRYARGLSNPKFKKLLQTTLFGKLKQLENQGLVTKQPFTVKYTNPHGLTQVRLVHLRRFYRITKANYRGYLQAVSDFLISKPNQMALYADMISSVGLTASIFKKLKNKFGGYYATETIPYRTLFPTCTANEWKTKAGLEKRVRVVKLLKRYHDTDEFDDDDDDENDDSEDEEYLDTGKVDDNDDDLSAENTSMSEKKKPNNIYGSLGYHRSILSQIMMAIQDSGERGLMERDIKYKLSLARVRMRHCMKELWKTKCISSIMRSYGKHNGTFLVTPEIADRLKAKKMEEVAPIPKIELDVSFDGEQMLDDFDEQAVRELDAKVKDLNLIVSIDRADGVVTPDRKKEESERKTMRKQYIIKQLSDTKVVHSIHTLFLNLCQHEKEQGHKEQMCRKSFRNIAKELFTEGKLYYINVSMQDKPEKLIQKMVVEPNTRVSDVKVKQALLYARPQCLKLKYQGSSAAYPAQKPGPKKKGAALGSGQDVDTSVLSSPPLLKASTKKANSSTSSSMVSICDLLDRNITDRTTPVKIHKQKFGLYGSLSKFERAEVLHKYMFYLFYEYKGNVEAVDSQKMTNTPIVYLDVDDWRRYLPPLKVHNANYLGSDEMNGTCMVGDFLLHMPIKIFCQLINLQWEIPGLKEILNHVDEKFYPIDALPGTILSQILTKRQYLAKLNENLIVLCQMGLLTFGPRTSNREIEFTSVYLHKKAMLLDTRNSLQGHIMTRSPDGKPFEALHYSFTTMDEVVRYWMDLRVISVNSKLGSNSVEDVKGSHGTISLLDASKPRSFEDVVEEDWLPGDRRGAAGLDSSVFAHRYNNWNLEGSRKRNNTRALMLPLTLSMESERELDNSPPPMADNEMNGDSQPAPKQRKRSGKVVDTKFKIGPVGGEAKFRTMEARKNRLPAQRKKKPRMQYMDDVDREAKKNMKMIRSTFSPLENGMLLLFQVTNCILSPSSNIPCVPSRFLRDILQRLIPDSKDKTANSVKGKSVRLIRDKRFRGYLTSYISQAMSDERIMSKLRSTKRPIVYSQEMQRLFAELFEEVRLKFSSPLSQTTYLPATVAELGESYYVRLTEEILCKTPKLVDNIKTEDGIKAMVVWELLESFLHLKQPLSGKAVYYTLSKYPNEVIHKAYNLLRHYSIIVQMKKFEKDRMEILSNASLLNNHKCMLRHKDALKSKLPADLFSNLFGQLEELRKAKAAYDADVELGLFDWPKDGSPQSQADRLEDEPGDFVEMNLNKYQGGANLAIISLIALNMVEVQAKIPDEMVRLDEEGKKKLTYKQPQSESARKRKLQALMESDEDSLDEWEYAASYKQQRSGKKGTSRQYKRQLINSQSPGADTDTCGQSVEKVVYAGNIVLSLKEIKTSASGVLGNFTVWVGSGSLLTLARTSVIEKLDLLTSKCLLQRNFIVETMKMKFALTDGSEPPRTVEHVTQPEKRRRPEKKPGSGLDKLLDMDTYTDLIVQLEKYYSPDLDRDDMDAILVDKLPAHLQDKGREMLNIIDNTGIFGISEEALEDKMGTSFNQLTSLLAQLSQADIVFKAGVTERKFVSRRHVRPWMVQVQRDKKTAGGKRNETVVYQCRLWRHFNGSLNYDGLHTLLHRVMTFTMLHPGIAVSRLCRALSPDVLPATTMDIIEILETIGCITLSLVEKTSPAMLFSTRRRTLRIGDNLRLCESERTINVLIEAPIKLAYFLQVASQHCGQPLEEMASQPLEMASQPLEKMANSAGACDH
ncbi:general transcription factor 3C polypeptide 1-like isoform X2 [Physella acuta]|uniref:general transcription factor 3C polypeptide 1-like isoform X2 n=1 Tax=Physella acuta TaxID=109671 RepID=UPI0027DAEAB6|nr:general transcription factor 3C polypeptide 1-like isoform X2 [Physella acuta]